MSNCYDIDPDAIRRLRQAVQRQTPAERTQKRAAVGDALQRFAQLNVTRRRPPLMPPPSEAQLRGLLIDWLARSFAGDQRGRSEAANAVRELERHAPNFLSGLERTLLQRPQLLQYFLWNLRERDHAHRVIQALFDSAYNTFQRELTQRLTERQRQLGTNWMVAHFGIVASALAPTFTPPEIPAKFLFASGTVYQIAVDVTGLVIEVVILSERPEQRIIDWLSGLHEVLALAFGPEEAAIAKAREFGRNLALTYARCLDEALFPNPIGQDAIILFGRPAVNFIAVISPYTDVVRRLASVILTPWTFGRFIGPLLLDVALAILDLVVPGAIGAVLLRATPRLAAAIKLVDDFFGGPAEVSQQVGRIARVGEMPVPEVPGAPVTQPDRLIDRAIDPPGSEVPSGVPRPDSPPIQLSPRGIGGSNATSVGVEQRGTTTVGQPGDAADAQRLPPQPRVEQSARGDGRQGSSIELPNQPPDTVNGVPLSRRLRSAWRRLAEEYGIDVTDEYTLTKLNEFYLLYEGQYVRSENPVRLMDARAAAGEFRTLIRYSRLGPEGGSSVRRIRFLRPRHGETTPDLAIFRTGRTGDTEDFVEVKTLTQASPTQELFQARGRHQRPIAVFDSAIRENITHGQISEARPGAIVFHAPFASIRQVRGAGGELTDVAVQGWSEMFQRIRQTTEFPPGLTRIEVTTGDDGFMIFKPPNWSGRIVRYSRRR